MTHVTPWQSFSCATTNEERMRGPTTLCVPTVPTGDSEVWLQRDAELKVEDSLRQALKRMATDPAERTAG